MKMKVILVAALFMVSSCNTIQNRIDALKQCDVSLKNIKITDYSILGKPGITFVVYLDIFNPNSVDVTIYNFEMNIGKVINGDDIRIARIKSAEKLKINSMDYGVLQVEMKTDPDIGKNIGKTVASIIQDLIKKQNPVISIDGNIQLDSALGKFSIPVKFQQEAEL